MTAGHVPPESVAVAARSGLALRASLPASRRGGTEVGIARARDLANRRPVSDDTLRRMSSYFARHDADRSGRGWGVDSKGWQAWLLWGGDDGRAWAKSVLRAQNPLLASHEDKGAAKDGLPWLVASQEGERLEYHASRVDACASANRFRGRVYRVKGSHLLPVGAK